MYAHAQIFKGASLAGMARKDLEMADKLPQDLSSLKRPALQKLCKRLGLKANGKNVEMVRLLEEYREKNEVEPVVGENSEPQRVADVERRLEERGEEREEEVGEEEKGEEVGSKGERCEMGKDMTLPASSVPTETVHEEEMAAQNEKEEENETRNEAENCEMEEDVPLANSDTLYEGGRGIAESERVRERRLTYSISPEPSATLSRLHGNDPVLSPPDNVVATPTGGSRKRRRTHSISPSSSLLQSGTISLDTVTASAPLALGDTISSEEKMCEGGSATDQIMALLDQRVANRKAEPGYVAPTTSVSSLIETHRQVGTVAKTTEKANKAHERLFSKMPSILEYSEKKKKRALGAQQTTATPGPPAKRQKVAAKTPKTPYLQPPKRIVKPYTNTKILSGVRAVSAMKPSAKPNFNFSKTSTGLSETPAAAATHAVASTKTNAKSECHTFTFSAKQPQIRKAPIKKAHTGKLPEFQWSMY